MRHSIGPPTAPACRVEAQHAIRIACHE